MAKQMTNARLDILFLIFMLASISKVSEKAGSREFVIIMP